MKIKELIEGLSKLTEEEKEAEIKISIEDKEGSSIYPIGAIEMGYDICFRRRLFIQGVEENTRYKEIDKSGVLYVNPECWADKEYCEYFIKTYWKED